MKSVLVTIILFLGVAAVGTTYFFNHGYKDNLDPNRNYIDPQAQLSEIQSSPQCIAKQQAAQVQIGSLQDQAYAIGGTLAHAHLPIPNGAQLLSEYNSLERKIWAIQTQAVCT